MIIKIQFLFCVLAFGCNEANNSVNVKNIKEPLIKEQTIQKENKNINCEISENINDYLDEIISNPHKYINENNDDNCVLSIIDSLNSKSIKYEDIRYFQALEAICNISDGYISEYLMSVAIIQYYTNLNGLLTFIKDNKCFKKMLIWGLSMDVSVGGDQNLNKIIYHAKNTKLSKDKRIILDAVILEIDPTIFD